MQFIIYDAVSSTALFAEKRERKLRVRPKNNNKREQIDKRKRGDDKYGK